MIFQHGVIDDSKRTKVKFSYIYRYPCAKTLKTQVSILPKNPKTQGSILPKNPKTQGSILTKNPKTPRLYS